MTNEAPIRVLVVDDQAVVRSGLAAFLSIYDNLLLVGEANDGDRAVSLWFHCGSAVRDAARDRGDGWPCTPTRILCFPQWDLVVEFGAIYCSC